MEKNILCIDGSLEYMGFLPVDLFKSKAMAFIEENEIETGKFTCREGDRHQLDLELELHIERSDRDRVEQLFIHFIEKNNWLFSGGTDFL